MASMMEIKRPYGIFVDIENIIVGRDREMNWRKCISGIRERFDGEQCALFRSYGNFSNQTIEFSTYVLEKLGSQMEKSSFSKNNTDMRIATDIQSFLEQFGGEADVLLLSGDSDYIPVVSKLSVKYFNKVRFFVLSEQKALSREWVSVVGPGRIFYLDNLYEEKETISDYRNYITDRDRMKNMGYSGLTEIQFLSPGAPAREQKIYLFEPGKGTPPLPIPVPDSFEGNEDSGYDAPGENDDSNGSSVLSPEEEKALMNYVISKWVEGIVPAFMKTAEIFSDRSGIDKERVVSGLNRMIGRKLLLQQMCETPQGKPVKGLVVTPKGFLSRSPKRKHTENGNGDNGSNGSASNGNSAGWSHN